MADEMIELLTGIVIAVVIGICDNVLAGTNAKMWLITAAALQPIPVSVSPEVILVFG